MSRQPPELKLPADGTCSFCGNDRRQARIFVGSSITDVRICDGCLGLCCSVLADMADARGRAPECSAADFPEDLLAEILVTLATKGPRATPPPDPEFRCSFCDATRPDEVPALVCGPRVFICSACVASAVALVKRELRA